MNWQIWITLSLLANTSQILFQRYLLKDKSSNPVIYVIINNLFAGIILSIYAFVSGISFSNITSVAFYIILSAFLTGIGLLLWFKSLKEIDASEFIVLFTSRAFWAVLASSIFLGERFSIQQIIGALLIFLGVYIASWKIKKFTFKRGEVLALISALAIGLSFTSDGFALKTINPIIYAPISFFATGLIVWLLNIKSTPELLKTVKSGIILKLFILGLTAAVTVLAYQSAVSLSGSVGMISVLNQFSTILVVIAGIVILKERDRIPRKIVASILSLIGVILIA